MQLLVVRYLLHTHLYWATVGKQYFLPSSDEEYHLITIT